MTPVCRALALSLVIALFSQPRIAHAGPTDTPLPTFSDGKPSMRVYHAVGVIKANNLQTDVICTNLDSMAVDNGDLVADMTDFDGNLPGHALGGPRRDRGLAVGQRRDQASLIDAGDTGRADLVLGLASEIAVLAAVVLAGNDKLHAIVDPAVSSLPPPPFTNLPLIRVP